MHSPFTSGDEKTVELDRNDSNIEEEIRYLKNCGWTFDKVSGSKAIFVHEANPVMHIDDSLKYHVLGLVFVTLFIIWMIIASFS